MLVGKGTLTLASQNLQEQPWECLAFQAWYILIFATWELPSQRRRAQEGPRAQDWWKHSHRAFGICCATSLLLARLEHKPN